MFKIKREELEKAIDAFLKELKVMLHAFDKDKVVEIVEEIYREKRNVMINDTINYLEEIERVDVL